MKPAKGRTWTHKVNDDTKIHQVKKLDKAFADIPADSMMLIATPKIIDEYIKQIPKGRSTSFKTLRQDLAIEFSAEHTCPITSGIFLRMVAEAAYEQIEEGKPLHKVTPFWRVIDEKSALNKKLSFGPNFVIEQRKKEGLEPNVTSKK